MFNKQPHQSFGVENEFIPASLLVPGGRTSKLRKKGGTEPGDRVEQGWEQHFTGGPLPDDGVHASYLWCTLEDTQCLGKGVALVSRGQRGPRNTNVLAYLTQKSPYTLENI